MRRTVLYDENGRFLKYGGEQSFAYPYIDIGMWHYLLAGKVGDVAVLYRRSRRWTQE